MATVSVRYFVDDMDAALAFYGERLGFAGVLSGPLVRSSYRAGRLYAQAIRRWGRQIPQHLAHLAEKAEQPARQEAASLVARGRIVFVNMTPCPTKTPLPIATPSQMNEWLEILQFAPTEAPFWISTNVPSRVPSPIVQPYRLTNAWICTSFPKTTSSAMRQNSLGMVFP